MRVRGKWVVCDFFFRNPKTQAAIFLPLGEGDTISAAWSTAFPPWRVLDIFGKFKC